MKKRVTDITGFSLVEILVVVAIISVMAVTVSVGFRSTGQTLRLGQITRVINDVIKQAELEVLRSDSEKTTIYFVSDYLAVVSEPEGTTLSLDFDKDETCAQPNDFGLVADQSGNLTKFDEKGNVLESQRITPGGGINIITTCFEGFLDASEREWKFQLTEGAEKSSIVRIVHFNLNRRNFSGEVSAAVNPDESSHLVIEAPYAKKTFFESDGTSADSIVLTFENNETGELKALTID